MRYVLPILLLAACETEIDRDDASVRPDASEDAGRTTDAGTEVPGLTDRDALTDYEGPYEIDAGTVVLEDCRLTTRLTIRGGDVTVRNCTANFDDYFHILVDGGTLLVEHSELDGMNTSTNGDDIGITGANITVRYSVFRGLVNAMRPSSNSLIEHNVIHMTNTAYEGAHGDGIEVYGGSNIVIRSNAIDISGGEGETGCVNIATDFGDIDDVLVEDNDFTGGTYSFYARLQGEGEAITNIRVIGNRWHLPRAFGTHSIDPPSAVVAWEDNTDEGAPLEL